MDDREIGLIGVGKEQFLGRHDRDVASGRPEGAVTKVIFVHKTTRTKVINSSVGESFFRYIGYRERGP